MIQRPSAKATLPSPSGQAAGAENLNLPQIGERLRLARKQLGMTQDALAARAGSKSKRGLQENEKGNAMPGGHIVGALALAGINTNWIFTGQGPMLLSDVPPLMPGATYPEHKASRYAVHESSVDALLLEKVSAGMFAYLEEHKDQVHIDPSRYAALITVLYKYAIQAGEFRDADLQQIMRAAV